jgi:hypothetical protein
MYKDQQRAAKQREQGEGIGQKRCGEISFEIFNHFEQISSPNGNLDPFPDLICMHFAFRNSIMKIISRIQLDNDDCNEL